MTPWQYRPSEVAYLLNPAFCSEVLRRCIYRYQQATKDAFPYILLFLVLPIILHSETRKQINPRQRLALHPWLESNQHVKIGFAERTTILLPLTKEAVIFLLQTDALMLDERADVSLTTYKPTNFVGHDQEDIADCFNKAEVVGRWFAHAGTPTNIYIMWGVKP